MAISDETPTDDQMLHSRMARIAGIAAIVGAAVIAAGAVAVLVASWKALTPGLIAYLILWALLQAIVAGMAVSLLHRYSWAQRLLLIYHLLLASAAVLVGGYSLLVGVPAWYRALIDTGMALPHIAVVLAGMAAIGMALSVLLVAAAHAVSRLRYASVVSVTIAAALTLAVVINLIVQVDTPWSVNVESSGQYRISPRMTRILERLDEPVTLTCVYTSAAGERKRQAAEYGQRTLELLENIADQSDRVKVVNVATDSQKAKVIVHLGGKLGGQYDSHIKFLEKFLTTGKTINKDLGAAGMAWHDLERGSYLDLWSRPAYYRQLLTRRAEKTGDVMAAVQREISSASLPDYARLTTQATATLTETRTTLEALAAQLRTLGGIAQNVSRTRKNLLDQAEGVVANAQAMVLAVGTPEKPSPTDPPGDLRRFIAAGQETIRSATQLAAAIESSGGPDTARILISAPPLQMLVPASRDAQGRILKTRRPLSDVYRLIAVKLGREVTEAENVLASYTPARQAEELVAMRETHVSVAVMVRQLQDKLTEATTQLSTVDSSTATLFDAAGEKKLYPGITAAIDTLIQQAGRLPKVEAANLSMDMRQENVIIVETGQRAEVIGFDAVWPQRFRDPWSAGQDRQDAPRFFNGNAAIGSKLLAMTHEPFAQVLLAHYSPPPTRYGPQADFTPENLTALTRRLEEANFQVKPWHLDRARPTPAPTDPKLQVLIVLPPAAPSQMPRGRAFGARHAAKIRQAIDEGIGAIFLAGQSPPQAAPGSRGGYAMNDYLLEDWGIEVRSDLAIIPAVPDPNTLDRFRINESRLFYLPVSHFSDHPISRPLQGRQTLWQMLCPIEHPVSVAGVSVAELAVIPQDRATWATSNFQALGRQFRTTKQQVWPVYAAGDKPSPFTLALAATRSAPPAPASQAASAPASAASKNAPTRARIVVMSMAPSLIDGYLDAPIRSTDARRTVSMEDAPAANADIVINSVYWLTGKESYVATGPARVPYVVIEPGTRNVLAAIFVLGVPAIVLAVGIVIMALRKW